MDGEHHKRNIRNNRIKCRRKGGDPKPREGQVTSALGALAVVARDENYWQAARVLGILAVPKRPMRVFKEAEKARAWLDSPAILASMPG